MEKWNFVAVRIKYQVSKVAYSFFCHQSSFWFCEILFALNIIPTWKGFLHLWNFPFSPLVFRHRSPQSWLLYFMSWKILSCLHSDVIKLWLYACTPLLSSISFKNTKLLHPYTSKSISMCVGGNEGDDQLCSHHYKTLIVYSTQTDITTLSWFEFYRWVIRHQSSFRNYSERNEQETHITIAIRQRS